MYDWMKKDCNICLAIGLGLGVVVPRILKAKKTRVFAVQTMAKGLILKDKVKEQVANLKDEAMDIYEDAKAESVQTCDCDCCDCDCED